MVLVLKRQRTLRQMETAYPSAVCVARTPCLHPPAALPTSLAAASSTTTVAPTRLPGSTLYSARALRSCRTQPLSSSKWDSAASSEGAPWAGHRDTISASPGG